MHSLKLIALAGAALLTGCQSSSLSRVGTDTLAAAAGGVVAAKASDNNPYWTLGGGLLALGGAEFAQAAAEKKRFAELALAFDHGKAQNAQLAYEAVQNAQRNGRAAVPRGKQYAEVPIYTPAHTVNGVLVNPTVEYVTIAK